MTAEREIQAQTSGRLLLKKGQGSQEKRLLIPCTPVGREGGARKKKLTTTEVVSEYARELTDNESSGKDADG